jgi:hypothetical protein
VLPWLLLPACLAMAAHGDVPAAWAAGLTGFALAALMAARVTKVRSYTALAPGWHLAHPLGVLMVAGIMLDGLWRSARGQGADWRGRTYLGPTS